MAVQTVSGQTPHKQVAAISLEQDVLRAFPTGPRSLDGETGEQR